MENTPHVTAFTTEDPANAQTFCLGIHLAVEFLHHLVGGEETEVTTLRGIGGPGVVQTDGLEQKQVPHAGEDTRLGEHSYNFV